MKMKKQFLFSVALAWMLSASISAKTINGIADTTRVYGIDEVVVTGTNQATSRNLLPYTVSVINNRQLEATGKTQLLSAISGEVPSLFVSQRNIFGFGVSSGGSGGIKVRGVGGLYVAEDVKHQNYALLGVRVTYKPVKYFDLFVHLDNLTNAQYEINKGYAMPGFTAMGGVKVKF